MTKEQRISALQTDLRANPAPSDAQLGKRYGCTRDAITYYIKEYGIRIPHARHDARKNNQPVRVERKPHGLTFGNPISLVPTLPRDVNAKAFQPLSGAPAPKRLWELERHECHWPVGEDPAVFCGCATDDSGRYCARHTKMSGKQVPRLVFA